MTKGPKWRTLLFVTNCFQEAVVAAEEMKKRGNTSFGNGDYYDALWKYEHATILLQSFKFLNVDELIATIHCNTAASCLKLGDEQRTDLLHSVEGFPIHQIMWYGFGHQHAHTAITLDPSPKIAHKVCNTTWHACGSEYNKSPFTKCWLYCAGVNHACGSTHGQLNYF